MGAHEQVDARTAQMIKYKRRNYKSIIIWVRDQRCDHYSGKMYSAVDNGQTYYRVTETNGDMNFYYAKDISRILLETIKEDGLK